MIAAQNSATKEVLPNTLLSNHTPCLAGKVINAFQIIIYLYRFRTLPSFSLF